MTSTAELPKIQQTLWFELGDERPGRHYILGNAHPYPGRILAWSPAESKTFFVYKDEMNAVSDQAKYWIEGFLHGAELRPPEGEAEHAEWLAAREHFHRHGDWPRPGWRSNGLADDTEHAKLRGMTFKVVSKPGQGQRWQTIGQPVDDLSEAVALAKKVDAWESGVFTAGPEKLAGFKYWSSHHPDLFNSIVVYG